jgi:hypothetical protein
VMRFAQGEERCGNLCGSVAVNVGPSSGVVRRLFHPIHDSLVLCDKPNVG